MEGNLWKTKKTPSSRNLGMAMCQHVKTTVILWKDLFSLLLANSGSYPVIISS